MNPDVLVKEIFEIINILREQEMADLSGDTLSRLAVKIASYKASLGEPLAEATKAVLDATAKYKHVKVSAYKALRDDGKGSTDAGELKNLEAHQALLDLNDAKYSEELLKNLSMNCHDIIDSIKSRLISLQTERSETHGS